ncbi:Chitin synthase regulator 2 [Cladobotryum mycophilum]|uniref:Chitin synthase regulator 2 n=1 Tax=Cladobotryum mycophilum TaxID=491253 RepID=A0ABR0S657_9HYPO
MAAVTTSPPPTSNSPNRRDSVPIQSLSPVARKPVPSSNPQAIAAPKFRDLPASSVRANFQQNNSAQPSNIDVDHAQQAATTFNPAAGATNMPPAPTNVSDRVDAGVMTPQDRLRKQDVDRNSRESDDTTGTSQQPASVKSSATTSASSLSGINENSECPPDGDSPGSSILEGNLPRPQSIPQFQYHQHSDYPQRVPSIPSDGIRTPSNPDLADSTGNVRRHLTPTSNHVRRSSLPRPQSAYSAISEGPRGRSPGLMPGGSTIREHSVQSRKSPDVRPSSYAELLNVPYPQQAPAPITLDNSLLRNAVGNNASLLSAQKTLEMYRQNVKKTNDFSVQYSFAVFLISVAQEQGLDFSDPKGRKTSPQPVRDLDSPIVEAKVANPHDLVREARGILQKLAGGGYPFAQYYLADGFASGLFNKGKEDYNSAFPLFVLAAKHGHAESAYRTALCYEFGWGCRKDPAKAVQFLRTAASKRHPGAMTRLGKACLSGDLGEKRYREGIKWMKLATEAADTQYNAAPYQLGCLYETGYGDDIFRDPSYAAELYTQAADLGHPEANFRMGDAYEHGHLNCPRDPALSVHFYTGAAERGHAGAMMGLCAWYMVGAPPMLEKDEEEAYEWANRSADLGYVKAQYAVGYFTEMGIGCRRDILEANVWYVKAADAGDERAKQRLAVIQAAVTGQGTPMDVAPPRNGKITKGNKDDKDCIIM